MSIVVGTVVGWMGKEFLPSLWRRIQGRPPVVIHVETDPAILAWESKVYGRPTFDSFAVELLQPYTLAADRLQHMEHSIPDRVGQLLGELELPWPPQR